MIRWLQTSLFGRPAEPEPTTYPVTGTDGRARKKTVTAAHVADAEFSERWTRITDGANISLELAPRLRQGWNITWRRGGAVAPSIRLRAPKVFGAAPDEVLRELAAWAHLAVQRKSPARVAARRTLEKSLHAWIDARHREDAHTQKLRRRRAARRLDRLDPKGRHHDLEVILATVVADYFGDHPEVTKARITWSARWGGLSTQTTAHDAQGNPYPLLTISRGYDHSSATPEIVGGVVYHECLHIVVPPEDRKDGKGRRVIHGREFRRREKEYRFYDAWRLWHAEKLPGIIRRGDRR